MKKKRPSSKRTRNQKMTRNNAKCILNYFTCAIPVIAETHGFLNLRWECGIDLISEYDIRIASKDIQYYEIDVDMSAKLGGLEDLPEIVENDSFVTLRCCFREERL